jgi:hypothetical protein
MTEAHVATLARRREVPDQDLTWVQASLLIDKVAGTQLGQKATTWLRENGASAKEAARVIERAEPELRELPGSRPTHAVDARLEVLDGAVHVGRRLSGGETLEREVLQRWQAAAMRDRLRQGRQEWARRRSVTEDPSLVAARRRGSGRPPPQIAR